MKKISKLLASAAFAVVSISSFAQTDLGAECGCPTVASRPVVLLSSLASVNADSTLDGNLIAANTILDCSKTWILDKKIYVADGKTLTIMPGTVVKGRSQTIPSRASALIIQRGGKILADGTETCPIVFTAEADLLDGNYSIINRGMWGGVVLLGKATNNLITTNTYSGSTTENGIGFIEGFIKADVRNLYGGTDDNDNSGILRYVSIRHAGAILALGNELNALSLGSIGRGTQVDHIETISSADDNIEFFGGAVDVKYASVLFGADDMFDYDLGWKGRGQFWYGLKANLMVPADGSTSNTADNGMEMDGDDDKKGDVVPFFSHPFIYNATIIGNGNSTSAADNSGPAALNSKERNGGEIYNSIFANFKMGLNLAKVQSGRTGDNAYQNWIAGSFVTKNCAFVAMVNPLTVDKGRAALTLPSDSVKFYVTDGNVATASIPGFDYSFFINGTTNVISDQTNPAPSPVLSSTITAPADGFFTPVSYKGAFKVGEKSWLSKFAYEQILKVATGTVPCATDINSSGKTDITDLLQILGSFNSSCQ